MQLSRFDKTHATEETGQQGYKLAVALSPVATIIN